MGNELSEVPLTDEEFNAIGLPKWPGLIVVGEPVTPDQAAEILLRTDGSYSFSCNDRAWCRFLNNAMGIEMAPDGFGPKSYEQMDLALKEIGHLSLHYLGNSRIASASIHGPSGWVNWNGTVGCAGFNIGKWPNVREVLEDWQNITNEWPFLNLRCQLLSEELWSGRPDEECGVPLIEYGVFGGHVITYKPKQRLVPRDYQGKIITGVTFEDDTSIVARVNSSSNVERGCSALKFLETLANVRATVASKGRALSTPKLDTKGKD